MDKLQQVKAALSHKLYIPRDSGILTSFLSIDEKRQLYFYRQVGKSPNVRLTGAAVASLPAYVQEHIVKGGPTLDNNPLVIRLKEALTREELKILLPGYRTFEKALGLKTTKSRELQDVILDIYLITHKPTGVRIFSSRVKSVKDPYAANLVSQAYHQLVCRTKTARRSHHVLLKKVIPRAKSVDWEIKLLKTVDVADARRFIRGLNNTIYDSNIELLVEKDLEYLN